MSPEQLRGEQVDARSDIYTSGAVLYEMATYRRAFGEPLASRLIDSVLHQTPVPPARAEPRISPELERIILKCLDKNPEQRYQAAKELLVDLRRLEQSISGELVTPAPPPKRLSRGAKLAAYGLGALVAPRRNADGDLRRRLARPLPSPPQVITTDSVARRASFVESLRGTLIRTISLMV